MVADEMPPGRHGGHESSSSRRSAPVSGLGPHVVGLRVVVRRVLRGQTGPTGGPAMTDVLGVCESWAEGVTTVRREDGSVVRIETADIVSGKPVPARPSVHRRLGAEEADRLAMPGWRPVESEPLGRWVLRASGGFSSRGNSVLALGDPGAPLDRAVTAVARWYVARDLTPRAHVHPGTPAGDAFVAAGWQAYESTLMMLGSVSRVLRGVERSPTRVHHSPALDAGWLRTDERAARHGEVARTVLEAGAVTFATVRDEHGDVVARGRGSFHADWLGVSSLWTRQDLRDTGLGGAVLRALLEWGAERGATTSYLQVVVSNTAAQQYYAGRGYEVHHAYDYLVPGSGARTPAQA